MHCSFVLWCHKTHLTSWGTTRTRVFFHRVILSSARNSWSCTERERRCCEWNYQRVGAFWTWTLFFEVWNAGDRNWSRKLSLLSESKVDPPNIAHMLCVRYSYSLLQGNSTCWYLPRNRWQNKSSWQNQGFFGWKWSESSCDKDNLFLTVYVGSQVYLHLSRIRIYCRHGRGCRPLIVGDGRRNLFSWTGEKSALFLAV